MKNILIIFGNITFEENPLRAIVHEVSNAMTLSEKEAETFADSLLNTYDAYLIPQTYKGEIIWKETALIELHPGGIATMTLNQVLEAMRKSEYEKIYTPETWDLLCKRHTDLLSKEYICEWIEPSYTTKTQRVTLDFFTEEKGYSEQDVYAITELEIGATYILDHHFITRQRRTVGELKKTEINTSI
jgi:hypothetical protein